MPLIPLKPSDETSKAFTEGLMQFRRHKSQVGRKQMKTGAARDALFEVEDSEVLDSKPSDVIPAFTLSLQDVLKQRGIGVVRTAGWRFLAQGPRKTVLAGDVIENKGGASPRLGSVSTDQRIQKYFDAIEKIKKLPSVKAKDYELRLLRIPGVLVEAIWLKSLDGGPELVVPILTRSTELPVFKPIAMDRFLVIASELAVKFLQFDQTGP